MFKKYQKLWQLSDYHKMLETHSSHLYWCLHAGQKVVLKIYKPHSDEAICAQYLLYNAGNPVVKVLQYCDNAILLQQVGSGLELANIDDAKALKIYCELIKKLQYFDHINLGFKPIIQLAAGFDGFKSHNPNDQYLIEDAKSLFLQLANGQKHMVNLHGDLHHYNIIQAQNGDWVIIDPKGYWGEKEYELGAFLRNPLNITPTTQMLNRRLSMIETMLDYDIKRVKQWAFCQAVLAAIWSDKADFYDHMLNVAKQFKKLL